MGFIMNPGRGPVRGIRRSHRQPPAAPMDRLPEYPVADW